MRRLKKRIQSTGTVSSRAAGQYHPHGTPATPMTMPLQLITYARNPGYPWGTAMSEELTPVWAPDGALVAARTNAPPPQLHAAGRPSPAHR